MHKLSFAFTVALWLGSVSAVFAGNCCPFCSAVSQTLRQEMEAMDAVGIAKIVKGTETESDAEFEMVAVIRGEKLIRVNQKSRMSYFGQSGRGDSILGNGRRSTGLAVVITPPG